MTETRGGFGEHTRHNEQRSNHAGNAEGQSRQPHEYAGSEREKHNNRVLDDIRSRLRQETTTIHPDGKGYTRTIRIHTPIDKEAIANFNTWYNSLSRQERRALRRENRRQAEQYNTQKWITGGLSAQEYLKQHPEVDPDLFTADGRYLPYCRFGDLRYVLKKLGKFLRRLMNPEDKEKKEEKPHLVVVQPPPEESEEPPPPQQPDAPKEQG